jgi:hypothetical protein
VDQCDQEQQVSQIFPAEDAFAMSQMWPMPMCGPYSPQPWLPAMQAAMIMMPMCSLDSDADAIKRPSVGSIGHPYTCAEPCKYLNKSRGCKDAALCDRCHLCEWKSSRNKKNKNRAASQLGV